MDGSPPWWDRKRLRRPEMIAAAAWERAEHRTTTRRVLQLRDQIHEAIYTGRPVGSRGREVHTVIINGQNPNQRLNLNFTQSKVDAITSRVSKHRVFPVIGSNGADYSRRRLAEEASQVLRAKLSTPMVQREKPRTHRSAMINGTGAMGVFRYGGDIEVRWVPRREIIVGDRDARDGRPRQLFHLQSMALEEAIAEWPHAETWLRQAASPSDPEESMVVPSSLDDDLRVSVLRAFHKPSNPDDPKDGRFLACLRDRVLEDREYHPPRFPYSFIHWIPPVEGMWGQGLVEILSGLQAEVNKMARNISEATTFAAALTIFKQRGSGISNEHLVGKQVRVVEHDGAVPVYIAPVVVSPSVFQAFERYVQLFDDFSGLARDYSTGQTQLGANASGRAIAMLDDVQSDRFAQYMQQDTAFMLDLGHAVLDVARDIHERRADIGCRPAKWIREFDWNAVRFDGSGDMELQFEPENFLASTRSGRLAGINELAAAGVLSDGDEVLDSFSEPDMQRILKGKLGARRIVQFVMDSLHKTDIEIYQLQPGPYFPLEAGIKAAVNEINLAEANQADPRVIDRIDQWIKLAKALQKKAAPPAEEAAAAAAAGGAPAADPAAADLAAIDPLAAAGAPVDPLAALGGALPPSPDPAAAAAPM